MSFTDWLTDRPTDTGRPTDWPTNSLLGWLADCRPTNRLTGVSERWNLSPIWCDFRRYVSILRSWPNASHLWKEEVAWRIKRWLRREFYKQQCDRHGKVLFEKQACFSATAGSGNYLHVVVFFLHIPLRFLQFFQFRFVFVPHPPTNTTKQFKHSLPRTFHSDLETTKVLTNLPVQQFPPTRNSSSHSLLPPTLNSPVPICAPGWREALCE